MENEKIIQILSKAILLHRFSFHSFSSPVMSEKEFHGICAELCNRKKLKKCKGKITYATGGMYGQKQIAFDD